MPTDFHVLLNDRGDISTVADNIEIHIKLVVWFLDPIFPPPRWRSA